MTKTLQLRSIDIPSIYKFGIGFEPMFDEILRATAQQETNYPPYNIVQINEDEYLISVAVAGFSPNMLEVTKEQDTLIIEGAQPAQDPSADQLNYLYKGIGGRKFRREFRLAEHVEINGAKLELGILNILLKRNIPEERKPKKIAIDYK